METRKTLGGYGALIKTYPACFGDMYSLTEAEMMDKCLSCPHFRRCEKGSPSSIDVTSTVIPREPDRDQEYKVKW